MHACTWKRQPAGDRRPGKRDSALRTTTLRSIIHRERRLPFTRDVRQRDAYQRWIKPFASGFVTYIKIDSKGLDQNGFPEETNQLFAIPLSRLNEACLSRRSDGCTIRMDDDWLRNIISYFKLIINKSISSAYSYMYSGIRPIYYHEIIL